MTPPVISIDNVHKSYLMGKEAVPALRGVTLDVAPGEFRLSDGAERIGQDDPAQHRRRAGRAQPRARDRGRREPGGHVGERAGALRLQKIGFIFQNYNLLSNFTAQENVEAPMVLARSAGGSAGVAPPS